MNYRNLLQLKVLLTADNKNCPEIQRLFNEFQHDFFDIELTDSYARTLNALQSDEYDFYIVNYSFEKKSFSELLSEIKKVKQTSNVIVLINADGKESAMKKLDKTSINYLVKEEISAKKPEDLCSKILRDNAGPKNEAGYQNLIENLPVMFYSVEPEPPYAPLYISPVFENFGYPLEKWRETSDFWMTVVHPEDLDRILRETATAMKNDENTDYEYRIIKKDGEICWIHDRGKFVKSADGRRIIWQGVMIDITEQKRTENLLRESEARYRQMFEGNQSVKLIIDSETLEIVNANPAACKFYGHTPEEFRAKKLSELNIASAEESSRNIEDAREDQKSYFIARHLLSSGEVRDVEIFSNLLEVQGRKLFYSIVYDITERKKAEEALKLSEERYRTLFENANDLVYVHDLEGNYISVNRAGERIFGYTYEESLALNFRQIIAPESVEYAREMMAKKIAGEKESVYEIECVGKNNRRVFLEINSRLVYKDGKPFAVQGIARDITERRQAEEALKLSEERFRDLFENANDLIYTHDLLGNFTSLNRTGEVITGYSREEALKMNISQVVAPEYLEQARQMINSKIEGELPTSYELEIITKSGERVTLELSTRLIYKDNKPVNVQGIARNITERKRTEEQLQRSAMFDPLTNLPNRTHFMKDLSLAVERAELDKNYRFAVLFLDLDRFKVINDSLGHAVGDKLLVTIAEKLKLCVRPDDVIARLGGDEFTILLSIKEDSDAVHVAERIQQNLSVPFKLENYEVFTSASIGIIISNEIRRTPEDVLRDADAAMYQAKETGKARYEIFDREMHVRNMNLLQLENDLRRAIERKEFEVYYQPIVELDSGQLCELEALIRWNHPEHGLVMPDQFISVAEETGLIIPIGEWILREACGQIKIWQKEIPAAKNLSISVNLSAKQLMHPALTSQIRKILKETKLKPEFLKLEVTESMVMEHSDIAGGVLDDLQNLGISLSTDDFGTGYSSLSYLHQFPFDRLKIDRSFISKMDSEVKSEAIVRTILLLGQNLEIEVTAEGIENEQQLWQLRSLGCRRGQGYLYSKPVNAVLAAELLNKGLLINMNSIEVPFTFLNHAKNEDVNN